MVAVLRVIHIVLGAFWAGAAILLGWWALPTARQLGPAAAPFMQGLLQRKMTAFLIGSGVLTVAAGIWLWFLRPPSFDTWQGVALATGATAAIIGLGIGLGLQRPTGHKIQTLGNAIAAGGGPPTAEQGAEMGRLQAKMGSYGNVLAYLFAIALAGMALSGV